MKYSIASIWMILVVAVAPPVWDAFSTLPRTANAATNPDEILDDPVLEARARSLAQGLRCLVCQNQSIDDSNAGLARDLRQIVRERLLAGDSDDEIVEYITTRYGDFVLLRPPMKPETWGLWYGPLAIFLAAGAWLGCHLHRRRRQNAMTGSVPLSPEEQAKFDQLLADWSAAER